MKSEGLITYAKNAVKYPDLHKTHLLVFIGLNGGQQHIKKTPGLTCKRGERGTEVRSLDMFSQGFAILQIYFLQVTKLTKNLMI